MASPGRRPFQSIRHSFQNLPRIEEESDGTGRDAKSSTKRVHRQSHGLRNSRSRKVGSKSMSVSAIFPNRASRGMNSKSHSVPNLTSRTINPSQEEELENENRVLHKRCLIYEATIGTLQSESLAYNLRATAILENMASSIEHMARGNQALLQECRKLEERIACLQSESLGNCVHTAT